LHTDSDRPDEPAHPHVHLCVLMRDEFGQRLNPRKNDLFEWRLRFAEKMREQGMPCAATAKEVNETGFTTQVQEKYDKTVSNLNYTPFKDIEHDDIQW
jgi:hypothetical protein